LATSRPQGQLSASERDAVLRRRAEDARELGAQARRGRRRARVRYAPLTEPGEPKATTVLSANTAKEGERDDRARRQRELLETLGLSEDLNRPRLTLIDGGEHAADQPWSRSTSSALPMHG